MLKPPLLCTELEPWRGGVRKWQRGQRDLLVSSHDGANILQGDIHILSSHRAPAHQLLYLVPRGLGCRWAGRWSEGCCRGWGKVWMGRLFLFIASEGPGPLQLVLDILRTAAMVHYHFSFLIQCNVLESQN
jgi:hypothetical protein